MTSSSLLFPITAKQSFLERPPVLQPKITESGTVALLYPRGAVANITLVAARRFGDDWRIPAIPRRLRIFLDSLRCLPRSKADK